MLLETEITSGPLNTVRFLLGISNRMLPYKLHWRKGERMVLFKSATLKVVRKLGRCLGYIVRM